MPLLPLKGALAIAAVVDITLNSGGRPVASKSLADRQGLPRRHLEPVLQALVHHGILRGIRGPRGGYELAREPQLITAIDILNAAKMIDEADEDGSCHLLAKVVQPALAQAEQAFGAVLRELTIDRLHQEALALTNGNHLLTAAEEA